MTRLMRPAGLWLGVRTCVALTLTFMVGAFAATSANAATNNIFTAAGTTDGLSGDDGPATAPSTGRTGWRRPRTAAI